MITLSLMRFPFGSPRTLVSCLHLLLRVVSCIHEWGLASFPSWILSSRGEGGRFPATLPAETCMEGRVPKDTLTDAAIIPRCARCILTAIPPERPRGPRLTQSFTQPGDIPGQSLFCVLCSHHNTWRHVLWWVIRE